MKVSVKLTRQQVTYLFDAVETAICMRNVGHVDDTFIINAHLSNLQTLRNKLLTLLFSYRKSYTLRIDHNAVLSLHYIFSIKPFDGIIHMLDALTTSKIFEAADAAMQIEVNMIKAAVRS